MAAGVEGTLTVVGHDDHAALVGRVAAGDEELGLIGGRGQRVSGCRGILEGHAHHVPNILSAASEGVGLTLVVDADQEGLLRSGSGSAIVVDLIILAVLLLLHCECCAV